jgi:23S rRNA (guanosine2251-2'-O)-methyltransferase
LLLRNPHSVLAAIRARPADVLEVRLPPQKPSGTWQEVADLARKAGVSVRTQLAARGASGTKYERQGAACAEVRELPGVPVENLWQGLSEHPRGLWLALDCLQDPHNVGAIFRTAAFFGVRGILLTRDRSAPMSGTVYDVASGGVESVPFAVATNLAQALQQAKQAGLWLLGSSERASRNVLDVPRDRAWVLIVGNEEHGLRRLTLEACDEHCGIPALGSVASLNAAVAAGVLVAALTRPS